MADRALKQLGEAQTDETPQITRVIRSTIDSHLGAGSLMLGLLLWETLAQLVEIAWLPPFTSVISQLVELTAEGVILENLLNSLRGLAVGFGIALLVSQPLGALMGRYKWVHEALDPYIYALFVSPTMIFVPIFFAIFGLTGGTRIAIIVVYAVFVMIINTDAAVRNVDGSLIEMARSYGAEERQIFTQILIPAALPLVFAGIQLGLGRGVKGMINGEMFIALVGLGALSQRFGGRFEPEGAMAIALVVLIVAMIANRVVRVIDNRLTAWTD